MNIQIFFFFLFFPFTNQIDLSISFPLSTNNNNDLSIILLRYQSLYIFLANADYSLVYNIVDNNTTQDTFYDNFEAMKAFPFKSTSYPLLYFDTIDNYHFVYINNDERAVCGYHMTEEYDSIVDNNYVIKNKGSIYYYAFLSSAVRNVYYGQISCAEDNSQSKSYPGNEAFYHLSKKKAASLLFLSVTVKTSSKENTTSL